jgi:hypothetical protein
MKQAQHNAGTVQVTPSGVATSLHSEYRGAPPAGSHAPQVARQ